MKLYITQHGEAASKDVNPERPLTDKGHSDLKNISNFLAQSKIQINQVYHSGKLRACQSAEYFSDNAQILDFINPNDDLNKLVDELKILNEDTLIVGHLPYMSRLVSYLTTGKEDEVVNYQPGSVVCLDRNDGNWTINWMIRPELLNE